MLSPRAALRQAPPARWLPGAMVILLLMATMLGGCGYRDAPTLEQRAQAAWAEMQAHCRQRAELAAALVDAVAPLSTQPRDPSAQEMAAPLAELRDRLQRVRAVHERLGPGTLTDAAGFRQFEEAENAVSTGLERLKLTIDRHAEARGHSGVLALRTSLEGVDSRISLARRDYVEAVRAFNTEIRTFPGVIWARLVWGSRPLESFAPASARPVAATPAS